MPFVRSMTWSGTTKSMGLMCSCSEPTAEKAMTQRTPRLRRAAMLARLGDLVRRELVVEAVAREEGHVCVIVGQDPDGRRRRAPRSRRVELGDGLKAVELREPRAAR